jgi:hypothetical protein
MSTDQKEQTNQYVRAEAIKECVDTLHGIFGKTHFRPLSFFLGVANTGITPFVVGRWPQHFWILYCAKGLVLLPYTFGIRCSQKKGWYQLDLCWVMNFLMPVYCCNRALALYAPEYHPLQGHTDLPASLEVGGNAFAVMFALGNGPLGWSVLALGNALVFHDSLQTAVTFIHLTPILFTWCVRWHSAVVDAAWPGLFPVQDAPDLFRLPVLAYLAWWVPYTTWLLLLGIHLPKRGHDTVYEGIRKGGFGAFAAKRLGVTGPAAQALLYMGIHMAVCVGLIAATPLMWNR